MSANDSNTPLKEVSWADYFDSLANEAWLESRAGSLQINNPSARVESKDDDKNTPFPQEH